MKNRNQNHELDNLERRLRSTKLDTFFNTFFAIAKEIIQSKEFQKNKVRKAETKSNFNY